MRIGFALATIFATAVTAQAIVPTGSGAVKSVPVAAVQDTRTPQAYRSWVGQEKAKGICKKVTDDVKWEECLMREYTRLVGYKVSYFEVELNGQKGTFKVSYSKITLPKGGKVLKKADKVKRGLNTSVYFKDYGKVVLGNNGQRYND